MQESTANERLDCPMNSGISRNFDFLRVHDERLSRLGALAERYYSDDPTTALVKLRQFGEFLAKDIAARHALLPTATASFDEVLRALRSSAAIPGDIADLFYHLKRVGNSAAHEDVGTATDALMSLKIARAAAIWFHRTYGQAGNFKPGPFIPPPLEAKVTSELHDEIQRLRDIVEKSGNAEAKAALKTQEAELAQRQEKQRADEEERQRIFWERYAAETETALRQTEIALGQLQLESSRKSPKQLDDLVELGFASAQEIDLDEAATRVIIDEQLRAAGWEADSAALRYSAGARPEAGRAMAIAEWPTGSGPVDYALFVDGRCIGVIEAKRAVKDVPGHLGQSKRYAQDIRLERDEFFDSAPWENGRQSFKVPFLFVTNGRPYVKQLATKSGIWFWDARLPNGPRATMEWFSPRDLTERLEQDVDRAFSELADEQLGVAGLRPYQKEALRAIIAAIASGQQNILVVMATGTGKTRLAISVMFELLRAKQARRVLFLVDRNALGRQTLDALSTTETSGYLNFDEVFPVADLKKKFPDATDRVQVSTVQAMVKRLFGDRDSTRPTPGTYDLIIVDEAHRGYTLDAELRDEDLLFRNVEDYLSAYKRVLDYFDATKVALTATPALHTRELFGPPVFRYGYRQAVVDGYLIDHRPPRRIITALAQTGITFSPGEEVLVIDPRTRRVDTIDLHDQVDLDVGDFNKKVYTVAFNRAVAEAIAQECPPSEPGKTLLFAVRDDHADILVEQLTAALTAEFGPQPHDLVEKITGTVDRPLDRIKAFKNDPRPKYVVTVDLLSTGIDVPEITNLVFVRRVNSRILYEQMLGRATRRCDSINKAFFRIFDAVDIYSKLQDVTDMSPVVVRPNLSFATLLNDLALAPSTERSLVRDQLVVKLRQTLVTINEARRKTLFTSFGDLHAIITNLRSLDPAATIEFFQKHPTLVAALDLPSEPRSGEKVYISEHGDELLSVEDDFGSSTSPGDYIESFETFVQQNMNEVPALIAATQKPRDLTRKELKEIASLLDNNGFSEASLRRAYGRARNADIAAHIIGFVRRAALGEALVPFETRVRNATDRILRSRDWTSTQRRWLERIGRALREQPVSDPVMLEEPLFAQFGGFSTIDHEFDYQLRTLLKEFNVAIWDNTAA